MSHRNTTKAIREELAKSERAAHRKIYIAATIAFLFFAAWRIGTYIGGRV